MEENISFNRKPIALPIDYRPIWKIGQILLIIRYGSSVTGCTLLKLHLFSWVFQSYKNREKLRNWIDSDFEADMSIWTLSPHLSRAVAFAVGERLIKEEKGKYSLTTKGLDYIKSIDDLPEAYTEERKILNRYGRIISDAKIDKLAKDWK